jgi:hypothetical protein
MRWPQDTPTDVKLLADKLVAILEGHTQDCAR